MTIDARISKSILEIEDLLSVSPFRKGEALYRKKWKYHDNKNDKTSSMYQQNRFLCSQLQPKNVKFLYIVQTLLV